MVDELFLPKFCVDFIQLKLSDFGMEKIDFRYAEHVCQKCESRNIIKQI